MTNNNEIQTVNTNNNLQVTAGFTSMESFNLLQRMTKMFNQSTLVPAQFRGEGNFGNCAIALNMAQRLEADPLMVMHIS